MDRTDASIGRRENGHATEDPAAQVERLRAYGSRFLDRVEEMVRERPGTAVLCALGVGFLIGRLVRR